MIVKSKKRIFALLVCMVLILSAVVFPVSAYDKVIPSTVDYSVDLNNSLYVFICNKKTLGSAVGTEYYMTYTVESVSEDTSIYQSGVIGTNVPKYTYPMYELSATEGGIYNYNTTSHNNADIMMKAGYTYFMKFTITEDGYKYKVAWTNDDTGRSKYVEFENVSGSLKKGYTAFGLWVDAYVTGAQARLVKVRCYDKYGNDLGVMTSPTSKAEVSREKALTSPFNVNHSYRITIEDGLNVAISNKKFTNSSKIYMEYTVESSDSKPYQNGAIITSSPKTGYPYMDGYMKFEQLPINAATLTNGPLLTPGAKYLVVFECNDNDFDIMVQKSYKGKNVFVDFPTTYGKYSKTRYSYKSLWISGTSVEDDLDVDCVLSDFKCYDEKGNNLGVQLNCEATVEHLGEIEDYAGCEAMYYCDDDGSYYAMFVDKTIRYTDSAGTTEGVFRIDEDVLTVSLDDVENREYNYLYQYFTDSDGKKYRRLNECKLIFDTGKGSAVDTQILNLTNGFITEEPDAPTLKGCEFEGWYTTDGKKFEFGKVLPNSYTVYAKWAGAKYAMAGTLFFADVFSSPATYIIGALLIIAAAVITIIKIFAKGNKNGI